ncbi:acyl-ACP--UDP-N-acetylglucosamine O-acyltransferase [Alkalilimnicola ehrlichii]|uniref:Acyl-[acyl-carrier-protein]--UDP-N-acetylglucosamine O-acyltransferase n=1 Tax=Alkalilimnicola ehrlichii TaxID=351052 RepID=A0A3E0WRN4_9GAMM|nr:acyl-ACP--UDP-N-acetylglucosamine O-acyltransferase [Alkalilimnicola ehrlichii]RFA34853.1 acyl-[acyl-carrier-protein]--UDP-N-acetylglucosamine O-acyltransferase [Alkalilimnicola ehrlichii]
MIDPRAVIDPKAKLGANVSVGPFSVIGADVEIGDDTWIGPHAVVQGPTRIGRENRIYQFASIGEAPQDKKYQGEPTVLEVGDRNLFREGVTVHRGTVQGGGVTRIGNDNWIMAYCHIAHDCIVGNNTTFSNSASLAGHVIVGDHAILGGFSLVHQFCRIGAYSFSGFGSAINRDVPPYVMVSGQMAAPHGINSEGLRRHGKSAEVIRALKRAYKTLYKSGLRLEQAKSSLRDMAGDTEEVSLLVEFLEQSERGIVR